MSSWLKRIEAFLVLRFEWESHPRCVCLPHLIVFLWLRDLTTLLCRDQPCILESFCLSFWSELWCPPILLPVWIPSPHPPRTLGIPNVEELFVSPLPQRLATRAYSLAMEMMNLVLLGPQLVGFCHVGKRRRKNRSCWMTLSSCIQHGNHAGYRYTLNVSSGMSALKEN